MDLKYYLHKFVTISRRFSDNARLPFNLKRIQKIHVSQLSHSGVSHRQYLDNPSACSISGDSQVSSYILPLAKNRKTYLKICLCISTTGIKDPRCTSICPQKGAPSAALKRGTVVSASERRGGARYKYPKNLGGDM